MEKIPTAEEFLLKEYESEELGKINIEGHHGAWCMIEFANLHVAAATQAILKSVS